LEVCRIALCTAALSALVALAGCHGGHAEFSGQVTYRGKPLYRGSITLVGSDNVPHIAAIGEDGTFRFEKVPAGVAKIGVQCPMPVAVDATPTSDLGKKLSAAGAGPTSANNRKRWFTVPEKYGAPETSGLTVEIESPSTNRTVDLQE
jgi:hypothetical protein